MSAPPLRGPDHLRPGPLWIPAGLAPGGLVLRVYAVPAGVLLLERRLSTREDAERLAEADADFVTVIADADVWLVAYDGDSGQRVSVRL